MTECECDIGSGADWEEFYALENKVIVLTDEIGRLRGIIERNCDSGQAKVFGAPGDSEAIAEIVRAGDERDAANEQFGSEK